MPGGLIVALFLLVRFAIYATRRGKGVVAPAYVIRWRTVLWAVLVGLWLTGALFLIGTLSTLGKTSLSVWLSAVATTSIALLLFGVLIFFPWWVVEHLTKRGKYRGVYYLSHFLLLFQKTGEPYATACFAAALTLARRGGVTRGELDWVNLRLAKEKRGLGLFGAAFGLTQAIEGRLANDEGRFQDAEDFRVRARILFGTITYLSPAAVPHPVQVFANEYLMLDAATRGEWSAVQAVLESSLSPTVFAIRAWARKNLFKSGEEKSTRRARSAAKLPIAVRLSERSEREPALELEAMFRRMSSDYVALVKKEQLPPRAILNLLQALDLFYDPRSPMCRLPPEVASDEAAAGEIAEAIADGAFEALRLRGAPVFALKMHGAVSARVYQKLETSVLAELQTGLTTARERTARLMRGTVRDEWIEVSRLRALYRRVEYTLGSAAAGSLVQSMFFNYGNFGVMLSETAPRRRPLAHAVFHCLRNEAQRFENADALTREIKNMKVTSGAD